MHDIPDKKVHFRGRVDVGVTVGSGGDVVEGVVGD